MANTTYNPSALPPYPQMILDAIEALNEKNGSNKTSISKYIESKYGNLPPGHSALLSHHLNRMKDSGQLVFWKNNYTVFDPDAPPRRGRGRPPKSKDSPPSAAETLNPGKGRGRPPKDKDQDPDASPKASTVSGMSASSGGTGRPRGRPRKMAKPSGGMDIAAEAAVESTNLLSTEKPRGRGRGRPPKAKVPLSGAPS